MDFAAALGEGKKEVPGDLVPAGFITQPELNQLLQKFDEEIDGLVEKEKAIAKITNEEENQAVVTIGGLAQKIVNQLELRRKDAVEPYRTREKEINNAVKFYQDRLKAIVASAKNKISIWSAFVRQEAARKQAEADAAAREVQAQLDAEAKKATDEGMPFTPATVVAPIVAAPPKVTRTAEGTSAFQRTEWTFEVLDEKKVPREYLELNEQKIRQAIKAGTREIPGLKIFEKPITVFRG